MIPSAKTSNVQWRVLPKCERRERLRPGTIFNPHKNRWAHTPLIPKVASRVGFLASRVGFEPATLLKQDTEITTEPPRIVLLLYPDLRLAIRTTTYQGRPPPEAVVHSPCFRFSPV